MVGGLRDVTTCVEFQIEIFMRYDFTGGRIFDFHIDFSMGLTTVQRYCAACDVYYGHSRHTRTCYTVYLYTTFMHFIFKRFNSFSLKLHSADDMFIFMNTLVPYMVRNKISFMENYS